MKKLEIKSNISVYNTADELDINDQKLLSKAHEAAKDAYAPYSNFNVGAAVRLTNGTVFPGSNQENAAYPTCLCAERTALSVAASQYPNVAVEAMAVTVKTKDLVVVDKRFLRWSTAMVKI